MVPKIDYSYRSPTNPKSPFLVFIHGAGGDKTQWKNQVDFFRKYGFGIIVLSLPGHGDSSNLKNISIENYSKAIANLFYYLGLNEIILIGHSMGGAISLDLIINFPNLPINKLILIGTGAKLKVAPKIFEMFEKNFGEALNMMGKFSYHEKAPLQLKLDNENILRSNGLKIILQDFNACDKFDFRLDLYKITIRTLIICGQDDQMTPVKYSSYLHDNIKNSELSIISDAGHYVFQEKAQEVNDGIHKFITSDG